MKTLQRSGFGVLAAIFSLVVLPGQALAGNALNVNVTLPVAKVAISGKVTKHGDGAVGGAVVELLPPGNSFPSGLTITDASGHFTFFDITTGDYKLAVNPHGNAPAFMAGFYRKASIPDHFTPFAGPATTLHYTGTKIGNVNVAVQPGHSISGRIRTATGPTPLKGVSVSASLDPTSGSTPFSSVTAATNGSGDYVIPGLPNGKYTVRADPNGNFLAPRVNFLAGCYVNSPPHNYTANCAGATLVKISNGNPGNKSLDIPTGHRITGALRDAQGHDLCGTIAASGTSLTIFPPSTTACGAFALTGLAPERVTDAVEHGAVL